MESHDSSTSSGTLVGLERPMPAGIGHMGQGASPKEYPRVDEGRHFFKGGAGGHPYVGALPLLLLHVVLTDID